MSAVDEITRQNVESVTSCAVLEQATSAEKLFDQIDRADTDSAGGTEKPEK